MMAGAVSVPYSQSLEQCQVIYTYDSLVNNLGVGRSPDFQYLPIGVNTLTMTDFHATKVNELTKLTL